MSRNRTVSTISNVPYHHIFSIHTNVPYHEALIRFQAYVLLAVSTSSNVHHSKGSYAILINHYIEYNRLDLKPCLLGVRSTCIRADAGRLERQNLSSTLPPWLPLQTSRNHMQCHRKCVSEAALPAIEHTHIH
jgi:hypothetical protein